MLHVGGDEEAAPQMRGVKPFKNFFWPVRQATVAEQKSEAAQSQVLLMSFDDPVGDECRSGAVIQAVPSPSGGEDSCLGGSIHLGISKRFIATVAPAEATEKPQI
jgi:hypothetical protein